MSTSPLGRKFDKARTPEAFDKLVKSDSPAAVADAAKFVQQLTAHSTLEKKLTKLVGSGFDTIPPEKLAQVKKLLVDNESTVQGFLEAAKSHHDATDVAQVWNYTTNQYESPPAVTTAETTPVAPLAKLDPLMDQPTLTGTLFLRKNKETGMNELCLKTAQGSFPLKAANPASYPYGIGAEISTFLDAAAKAGSRQTVSVRGWMVDSDPKKPVFVMERFCPGETRDFISGRISLDDKGRAQMNVGGKMVHFADAKLAAQLKNYEKAGLILPGEVKNKGTIDKPNYVFVSPKPAKMWMLGALVSSAYNYNQQGAPKATLDAKRDKLVYHGISPGPATSQNPTTYYVPKEVVMTKYTRQLFEGTLATARKRTDGNQPRAFDVEKVWFECGTDVQQYQGTQNTPNPLDLARYG